MAVSSVVCSDGHVTATPQMVVRRNLVICNVVGMSSPRPQPFSHPGSDAWRLGVLVPVNSSARCVR